MLCFCWESRRISSTSHQIQLCKKLLTILETLHQHCWWHFKFIIGNETYSFIRFLVHINNNWPMQIKANKKAKMMQRNALF